LRLIYHERDLEETFCSISIVFRHFFSFQKPLGKTMLESSHPILDPETVIPLKHAVSGLPCPNELRFQACSSNVLDFRFSRPLMYPWAESHLLPAFLEDDPRMQYRETDTGKNNHGSLKNHEGDFLIGELTSEPSAPGPFRRAISAAISLARDYVSSTSPNICV
jgi:hypothetical protein